MMESLRIKTVDSSGLIAQMKQIGSSFEKPAYANAHFELNGYQTGKFVALYLPDDVPVYYFPLKAKDGWAGDFALPAGDVYYAFLVDGKMISDPTNPQSKVYTSEAGSLKLNRIAVK